MNAREFLALTESSFRKVEKGSYSSQDIQILQEAHRRLARFYTSYLKKFKNQFSGIETKILNDLILQCKNASDSIILILKAFTSVRNLIFQFANQGAVYLVRHPEPILESYQREKDASRTLTFAGKRQVWKFNRYLRDILAGYPPITVELYSSPKYRTKLFATLTHHFLRRNVPCIFHDTAVLEDLYVKTCVPEMKEMYPKLKVLLEGKKNIPVPI